MTSNQRRTIRVSENRAKCRGKRAPRVVQGAIDHAQRMHIYQDPDQGSQPTPPIIPKLDIDDDPSGRIGTFQPDVATITANNAFFQNLGTNGCNVLHLASAADRLDRQRSGGAHSFR